MKLGVIIVIKQKERIWEFCSRVNSKLEELRITLKYYYGNYLDTYDYLFVLSNYNQEEIYSCVTKKSLKNYLLKHYNIII